MVSNSSQTTEIILISFILSFARKLCKLPFPQNNSTNQDFQNSTYALPYLTAHQQQSQLR